MFALAAALLAGCQGQSSKPRQPREAGAREGSWTLLQSSQAPFTCMLVTGGKVRIVNAATGEQIAAPQAAAPNTRIEIDPFTGINVGPQKVVAGPLPANVQYEIWWEMP